MRLPGAAGQVNAGEILYDASGTIVSATAGQLILPKARSRSSLIIENISAVNMYFEFGGPRATASLTNGVVTSISVTNAGFLYTIAPTVELLGGAFGNGNQVTPTFTLQGLPEYPAPTFPAGRPAKAHCIMTGSAGAMTISSIVVDDGGSGYLYPPYVYIRNNLADPFGAANPYQGSTASGIELLPQGSYTGNGTICTTDQVSVFCGTMGSAYTCKYSI